MTNNKGPSTVHIGRNIKRFREWAGLKQDGLADKLGSGWTQKKVSELEASESIDSSILEQVALALKIAPETILSFTEEGAAQYFQNFHDNSSNSNSSGPYFNCTINPFNEYVEMVKKNERLYEALLKSEREKIELLERLLEKKD